MLPVSYTHLDVYKRQDDVEHHDEAGAVLGQAVEEEAAESPDRTGRPTSITNESRKVLRPAGKK